MASIMEMHLWSSAASIVCTAVVALMMTSCAEGSLSEAATGEPSEVCNPPEPGYILPASGDAFWIVADRAGNGPFIMLNLYRLREFADYSASPELAPETPISGATAFEQLAATLDAGLAKVGGEILFRAEGGVPFIGPSCERWDIIQLVRYPSYQAFTDFAATETVIKSIPHRFAILEDSRVVPFSGGSLQCGSESLSALNH